MHSESRRFHTIAVVLSCAVALVGCSSSTPATGPDGGGTPDAPTSNPADAPTTNPTDAGTGTPDGATASYSCTSGTLFAGDPTFDDPDMRPVDGTGIRQDPPFPYRMLVFTGGANGQMITHDGQEIWRVDLATATLHKIAGDEAHQQALVTGPCAGARFANMNGIAIASDGSVFVSDQTANAILKITHPLGADCTVSHYAGTPDDIDDGSISPDSPPNVGNVDGKGSMAKFALPERPAVDANDNVYVWDHGNDSIRKIASDADHTVSTFLPNATGGDGTQVTLVALAGSLYVYGQDSDDNVFIESVDLATKAKHDLLRGGSEKFGIDPSEGPVLGGIVTDGVGIIVFYDGQLFYLKTNGTLLPPVAGMETTEIVFPDGYDPTAMHAAADLNLPIGTGLTGTAGADGFLAIDPTKNLYVSGSFLSSPFVEKINCGP